MAPQKGKKAQEKEQELVDRITAQVNASLDSKLERFLMAAQARPEERTIPSPNIVRTRKRAREDEEAGIEVSPVRPVKKQKPKPKATSAQSSSDTNRAPPTLPAEAPFSNYQHEPAPRAADDTRREANSAHAYGAGRPQVQEIGHKMADVNINNPWMAWSALQPQTTSRFGFDFSPASSVGNPLYDANVDSQVHRILASSVHNLAKGNVQAGVFPFKHVLRGPEKRQAQINSVTLSEHLWGMFRIIDDPKVDNSIKPELMRHMQHIVEDEQEFDWESGVRRWSEEVFSRVAQNRLPLGWHSRNDIEMLRLTISKVPSAKLPPREAVPVNPAPAPRRQNQFQQQHTQQDVLKGGPPCPNYNSSKGCSLPSGHMSNGKKMVHVCSFCLFNTSAANVHSEAHCRNKIRLANSASHFQ